MSLIDKFFHIELGRFDEEKAYIGLLPVSPEFKELIATEDYVHKWINEYNRQMTKHLVEMLDNE